MLSIGRMSSGQEAYYTNLASEQYYTESGEPPGQWFGGATKQLGVSGQVKADELRHLMQGFSRNGQVALVRNAGHAKRRPGLDLTFGAPKSVSVLWALCPSLRSRIQAAHHLAVTKTLKYLEQDASWTRMGMGGAESQKAKLLVGMFEHGSARGTAGSLPDPHLHTHCLLVNTCVGVTDGRTRTLDGRHFFRHKMTAGVLYRAELFSQLRELGLTARRGEKWCELEGVSKDLCKLFSKRRSQIETYLEELGLGGAKDSAQANLATRSSKVVANRDALFAGWEKSAQEQGIDLQGVSKGLAAGRPNPDSLIKAALPYALEKLTDKRSFFAKRDVLRAVAEEVEEHGVGIETIRKAVNDSMTQLVSLRNYRGERQYTTKDILETERSVKRLARALWHRPNAIKQETMSSVIDSVGTLRSEQEKALWHVTQGGSLALVSGLAGTGKTFMLNAARKAWEASGKTVMGCALAAAAAQQLERESGIVSSSIHRTLFGIEKGRIILNRNSVLVLDEAGMVGTKLMSRVLELVSRAGAKLVLTGDAKQLSAINAGAPFRTMEHDLGGVHMVDIRRQNHKWARDAVREFSDGQVQKAMARYVDQGLVFVGEEQKEVASRIVSDWKQAVLKSSIEQTSILTGTVEDSRRFNRAIQKSRLESGELSEEGIGVGGNIFFVGDRLRFRKNTMLFKNGEAGEVVSVSPTSHQLTVRLDRTQERVTIDALTYQELELGYASTTHAAQGATVQHCLVFCDPVMTHREAIYVQVSRAKAETRFYMDKETAGEGLSEITALMQRSRQKEMALDLMPASTHTLEPMLEAA